MKLTKKKYGFNIVPPEFMDSVDGLWETTLEFMKEKKMEFSPYLSVFGNTTTGYNGIQFW